MMDLAAQFPTFARLVRGTAAGWRWWTGQLAGMLPGAGSFGTGRPVTAVVRADGTIADPPPAGRPVELRLPAAAALRKAVTLPAAAEDTLREVLAFEMDRETPFRAEAVRFDARILVRQERQIQVDLLVVPRALADAALASAARQRLTVARLTVEAPDAAAFDLRDAADRPPVARPSRLLAALAAVLAVAVLATPPLLNRWRADRLDALIVPVQERAGLAFRLRDELDRRSGAASALDVRKAERPLALAVLAEVSAGLPDGVWLDQFRLSGPDLRLSGFAPAAAELIPLIDGLPLLEKVRFETGVVQDPMRKRERFQIGAAVAGPAGAGGAP